MHNERALAKLDDKQIGIAVELGVVKEWDCSAADTAVHQAGVIVANVQRLVDGRSGTRSQPRWLCMDEPLVSALGPCKLSLQESAAGVRSFFRGPQRAPAANLYSCGSGSEDQRKPTKSNKRAGIRI